MTDKIEELIGKIDAVRQNIVNDNACGVDSRELKDVADALSALRTQRNEVVEECARTGYRVCAETRHVTLGDKVATAIRNLKSQDEPR